MANNGKSAPNGKSARSASTASASDGFTVPGLGTDEGRQVAEMLQDRLVSLLDLQLTLKHIHWNVVGPFFIGVHQMIDPQVAGVQAMIDETAERVATLGSAPNGLAGNIVARRQWDDYSLGRANVEEHLGALDLVYAGVISSHRDVMDRLDDVDPVSQDMIIGQIRTLELYQWFVRAHLESAMGQLATSNSTKEVEAARAAKTAVTAKR